MHVQGRTRVLAAGVVVAFGLSGCGGSVSTHPAAAGNRLRASVSASADLLPIPQPDLSTLNRVTRQRLAPDSARIDLLLPPFSNSTGVTNALFPIAALNAVILGEVAGEPLKIETTLLPETKVVTWHGRRIEALQSQFCAFLNGRITELAVDLYAQADDGSVWYLGEDVVDYQHGMAESTEGTWRVGLDGPPAMIMPGHPTVGNVYRTENIPGIAFEQVTVKRVGVTVAGPTGPVGGAMVGQELHQDEKALEAKVFAPGYGEFFSGGGHDFEANALSVPADARPGPVPDALKTLLDRTRDVVAAARSKRWTSAAASLDRAIAAWLAYQAGGAPDRLASHLQVALASLATAVDQRRQRSVAQSALHVMDAVLDLELQHRSPSTVNKARLVLWSRQLALDARARRAGAVHGDVTTIGWIRDRLDLDPAAGANIDDQIRYLRAIAEANEFRRAATQARRLRDNVRAAALVGSTR
ncbi:MAG: hypothetical protein QOD68_3501 [Actinomycetota bacterium]|jgi:hypothetical protein|nr:hypothetical protein [Actinomycetota bacterium]